MIDVKLVIDIEDSAGDTKVFSRCGTLPCLPPIDYCIEDVELADSGLIDNFLMVSDYVFKFNSPFVIVVVAGPSLNYVFESDKGEQLLFGLSNAGWQADYV